MPVIFKLQGKIIMGDYGSPDPESFIEHHKLPMGTVGEEVTNEEFISQMGINEKKRTLGRFPDSIPDQVKKLKDSHEAIIAVLEDHLKLQKGNLKAMIEAKLKEK